jgi:hypothetical protein
MFYGSIFVKKIFKIVKSTIFKKDTFVREKIAMAKNSNSKSLQKAKTIEKFG